MAVKLSGLRGDRPLPQEDSWYSFLREVELTTGLEELGHLSNPATSLGIEPTIFWLVA
jgi:hypothetical protein